MSADAVIVDPTPTLTVATAKIPTPDDPGIFTKPVLPTVAARATMSGTGDMEADNSSVLMPVRTGAEVPPQARLN